MVSSRTTLLRFSPMDAKAMMDETVGALAQIKEAAKSVIALLYCILSHHHGFTAIFPKGHLHPGMSFILDEAVKTLNFMKYMP